MKIPHYIYIWLLILIGLYTGLPTVFLRLYDLGDSICYIIASLTLLKLAKVIKMHNIEEVDTKRLITSLNVLALLSGYNFIKLFFLNVHILNPSDYIFVLTVVIGVYVDHFKTTK